MSGAHATWFSPVDEGQFVFVEGVQYELHANKAEDEGNPKCR